MTISARNLTVEYTTGGYTTRPLDGLSFHAEPGELVLLLGASGCGKTTLLSVLGGILEPTAGTVTVDGIDVTALTGPELVSYRRHAVGFVFQAFNLVPSLTAQQNVEAPLRFAGVGRPATRAKAAALLERVNLTDRAHHRPAELSGGQQQRVAIARSLVHDAPVLLADEPTAHLDYIQVEGIVRLLRELASGTQTVVVATHDSRLLPVADRVVELTPQQPEVSAATDEALELAADDILFRQGDECDCIYLVTGGSVDVLRERADGRMDGLAIVSRGQYVGELGPLLGIRRSATARAGKRGATLRRLSAQQFRAAASDSWRGARRPLRAARPAAHKRRKRVTTRTRA